MFTAQIGVVNKRINDLKRPAFKQVYTVSIILKDDCSIIKPVLRLQMEQQGAPQRANLFSCNYCQIAMFNRYYWITNIVAITSYVFDIYCEVDTLATFYSDIILQSAFVEYSASQYNGMLPDTRLPKSVKSDFAREIYPLAEFDSVGTYILTAVTDGTSGTTGFTQSYALSASEMSTIAKKLLEPSGFDLIKEEYYNPLQAVVSCIWIPVAKSSVTAGSGTLKLGKFNAGSATIATKQITGEVDVKIPVKYINSITNSCADYRNCEPYSECSIWLPGVGLCEIPLTSVMGDGSGGTKIPITVEYDISVITGDVNWRIYRENAGHGRILSMHGLIGVNLPVASTQAGTVGTLNAIGTMTTSAATAMAVPTYAPFAAAQFASGLINFATSAGQRTYSGSGAVGGFQDFSKAYKDVIVFVRPFWQSDLGENIRSNQGLPLFKVKQINELTGYCKCANSSFSTGLVSNFSATLEELQIMNNLMNSGVYINE